MATFCSSSYAWVTPDEFERASGLFSGEDYPSLDLKCDGKSLVCQGIYTDRHPEFNPNWSNSGGRLHLTQFPVARTYYGYWLELKANESCKQPMDKYKAAELFFNNKRADDIFRQQAYNHYQYWGGISFQFSEDYSSYTATWDYCGEGKKTFTSTGKRVR